MTVVSHRPAADRVVDLVPGLDALVAALPRPASVAWVGGDPETFRIFRALWTGMSPSGHLAVPEWVVPLLCAQSPDVTAANLVALFETAEIFCVDFGACDQLGAIPVSPHDARVRRAVASLVARDLESIHQLERARVTSGRPRRTIVCINPPSDVLETLDSIHIFGGGAIRCGVARCEVPDAAPPAPVLPGPLAGNLIGLMHVGEAGRQIDGGVLAPWGVRGVVLHGPHRRLAPGDYRLRVTLGVRRPWSLLARVRPIIVEISRGDQRLVQQRLTFRGPTTIEIDFHVPPDRGAPHTCYLRVLCGRWVEFLISRVEFLPLSERAETAAASAVTGERCA